MRYREITETETPYDLQGRYDTFNRAYFDGALPTIPLQFADLKSVGGAVKAKIKRIGPASRFNKYANCEIVPGSMILQLSSRFKRSAATLDAILLHEMIHVYFNSIGDIGENHGSKFLAMMRKISVLSGIRVPLKDTVDDAELSDPTALKAVGVILLTKPDGGFSFSLISAKMAHADHEKIIEAWKRRVGFKTLAVYTVATPEWTVVSAKYPISRKLDGGLYYLKDPSLVANLIEHGHKLSELVGT
jgi:hypothetical protein